MNIDEEALEYLEKIANNTAYTDQPIKEELEGVNKRLDEIVALMEVIITNQADLISATKAAKKV